MADLPGVTPVGVKPEPVKPMQNMGVPGFQVVGGYVNTPEERNPKLIGEQKWITASDILANVSIVAAGVHYFLNLVASPEWKVEPADDSAEAKALAEFAEECMYDMERSWHRVIRRSAMFRFYGFGLQEWQAKRRDDGRIGMARLAPRPQHTIQQWDIDGNGDVKGVVQYSPLTFQPLYIPRGKLVYLVDDSLTDSPEGFGLLRHLAEPADRYMEYKRIEGSGFERDFRGVPIGYAPLADIERAVAAGQIDRATADTMKNGLAQFVAMRAKATNTGLLLDSSTYASQTDTGSTPSSVKRWGIELLTGSAQGIDAVGAAIEREMYDMALILGVEGLLVGKDSGSRALSEDKSRNLYLTVNSCTKDIGEAFDKDFFGPLWKLNGFDEKLKPSLQPEDVSFKSVEEITAALKDMAAAGAILSPTDPVINDVRTLLGVSEAEEYVPLDDMSTNTATKPTKGKSNGRK
ncbi:DUF935 domain-containing protein [Rhizobium phage RHph_TM3_3_9]|nr:DUF935 domain-containing protein [Rhizobium phage RHph_TM3_3_9]QIG68584.1 DUF935 domain-containing protein [Rhizobium phage RHph_TM3_3_13]QIG74442.1 DUF935 domain-containing protein [Rhizobium phage RHph_TM3_3_10]QXV74556.1 protein of unknown function DUF935 [Rhizobium phage RHEph19]